MSSSIMAMLIRTACWFWICRISRVTAAVTLGLPSRSPPIQEPNRMGAFCAGSVTPCSPSSSERSVSISGMASVRMLVEVVDGVAGLVHRGGPDLAELVRLPHLVDDLGQLAVLAAAGRGALLGGLGQHVGELADLVQHGAARGLGGVRGEDGADVELVDHFLQHRRAGLAGDVRHRLGQPAVLLLPGAQPADPVDLFGGVGQVEVEGEGPDQVGRLLKRQGAEQLADLGNDVVRAPRAGGVRAAPGGLLGFLGQQAHLLHEVEELGAVLADQGFAQQGGDPAYVGAEFGGEICF